MKKSYLFLSIFYGSLLGTITTNKHINGKLINIENINLEKMITKKKREKITKLVLAPLLFTSLLNFYVISNNYENSNSNSSIIGVIISFLQILTGITYYFIVNLPYKILELLLNGFLMVTFLVNLGCFLLKKDFMLNILYAADEYNDNFNYIILCNYLMYALSSFIFNLKNTQLPYWKIFLKSFNFLPN